MRPISCRADIATRAYPGERMLLVEEYDYTFEDEDELEFLFADIAKIMRERERERERAFKSSFQLESSTSSRYFSIRYI